MVALDTNAVVRLSVGDHAEQARANDKQGSSLACTVDPSVLMACEGVLHAVYRLEPALIASSCHNLLELRHIDALDPVLAQQALRAYDAGLDFADALHAARRRDGERFITCDRQLARCAPKGGRTGACAAARLMLGTDQMIQ